MITVTIVGIDLGTRRIAASCVETGFVWSTHLQGAADRRTYPSEVEAGFVLGLRLKMAIEDHHFPTGGLPLLFVAERPFLRTARPNVQTAVGMALSAGAALGQLPGRVSLVRHPSMWKKALCGNGNADKAEVRRVVTEREPALAALCGEDEDRYDSLGIALASAQLASDGGL